MTITASTQTHTYEALIHLFAPGDGAKSTTNHVRYRTRARAMDAAKAMAGEGAEYVSDGHGSEARIGYRGAAGTAWISEYVRPRAAEVQ